MARQPEPDDRMQRFTAELMRTHRRPTPTVKRGGVPYTRRRTRVSTGSHKPRREEPTARGSAPRPARSDSDTADAVAPIRRRGVRAETVGPERSKRTVDERTEGGPIVSPRRHQNGSAGAAFEALPGGVGALHQRNV